MRRFWVQFVFAAGFAGLLGLLHPDHAVADVVQLPPDNAAGVVPLGRHVGVLEDPGGKMTAAEVARAGNSDSTPFHFKSSDAENLNFGLTRSAYWLRFELENPDDVPRAVLLEVGNAWLDLTLARAPGLGVERISARRPFADRGLLHEQPLFALHLAPHERAIYFLRVEARVMDVPLALWSERAFAAHDHETQLVMGMYFGIMLIMVLYNLFVFLFLRELSYLYYSAFVGAWLLHQAASAGYAFEYLWPGAPWWHDKGLNAITCLAIGAMAMFTGSFLDFSPFKPATRPRIRRAFDVTAAFGVLGGALIFSPNYFLSTLFTNAFGPLAALLALVTAGLLAAKGSRPAKLFLIAFLAFLAGSFLYVFQNVGLLPKTLLTQYGLQAGSALYVVLLSLCLGDRINSLRKEKARSTRIALESQRKLALRLELILEGTRGMALATGEADAAGRAFDVLTRELPVLKSASAELLLGDAAETLPQASSSSRSALVDERTLLTPVETHGGTKAFLRWRATENLVGRLADEDLSFIDALSASLGVTFENVAAQRESQQRLRVEAQHEAELEAARAVQETLLPHVTTLAGFDVDTFYRAADSTGGDWFNYFFDENSGQAFFLIGDVTGHGVPSALVTGVVSGATLAEAVRARLQRSAGGNEPGAREPVDIVTRLTELAQLLDEVVRVSGARTKRYMTMLIACVERATGVVHYVNAGHAAGVVLRKDSTELLPATGSQLGFSRSPRFAVKTLTLQPKDVLFLYTDGLTETESAAGATLDVRRLRAGLSRHRLEAEALGASEDESVATLPKRIWSEAEALWDGVTPSDDVAMLCVRWLGETPVQDGNAKAG